ncbi:hypothetical protein BTN50_0243 [Candidatus Enterovibrio altilux]|uniref:Mobile element protein n=1 Tax=Candidatus Enterovibrio altilux TaxID=1927128 RepID=A0A291B706_9GAMM|nr:hypothetical protein BTN50_0243 [Candidatus Enterovibrio luxaltus]
MPDISLIFWRVCLSKLGSTSRAVTLNAFNSAAMISCVLTSIIKRNLRQTQRLPSILCFFTYHSLSL